MNLKIYSGNVCIFSTSLPCFRLRSPFKKRGIITRWDGHHDMWLHLVCYSPTLLHCLSVWQVMLLYSSNSSSVLASLPCISCPRMGDAKEETRGDWNIEYWKAPRVTGSWGQRFSKWGPRSPRGLSGVTGEPQEKWEYYTYSMLYI